MIKSDISKILIVIFIINVWCSVTYSQTYYSFKGKIVTTNNTPLAGATVVVSSSNKGTNTNAKGEFNIHKLKTNTIKIKVSFVGYQTLEKEVSLLPKKFYTFQLKEVPLQLNEVVIKDNYLKNKKEKASLNIDIVNKKYVKQNLGGSLMKSLERLPGLTTIDIGSGQSKPVIRGLGFNRVVVVENNIKHEAQQWGVDHGLEIDQYAVDDIQVIKGPASLQYGSDAIGGVIDIRKKEIPAAYTFGGTVDLTGKTNNDFLGSSVSLFARKKDFFATLRGTFLDYADYRVPTNGVYVYNYRVPLHNNQLRNTAGKEQNIHATFGVIKDRFQSKVYISNVNSKSGFFANAHGLEPRNVDLDFHDASSRDINYPFQKVNHFKLINSNTFWSDNWELKIDLGYQRNFREEWSQYVQHGYMPAVFPDGLDFDSNLERQFKKDIFSANTKLFYELTAKTKLDVGLNTEYQKNNIDGRGFIIPSYQQLTTGIFVIAKHELSNNSSLQAGLRYDYGNLDITSYNDWFASPTASGNMVNLQRAAAINRNFSNFTWSLGYTYNPSKWSYKFNIGKSFRMPIAKELAANGVNYHRFSYEVGNANLSPEISYQFDTGITFSTTKFTIGASPFVNYFSNYIYLNPTAQYDRLYGFGNQVFNYTQSKVFRYGTEVHAHYKITDKLQVGFIGEYVYSEQLSGEKKGYTLPFSPPASGIFNIKYKQNKLAFIKDGYLSLDYKLTAAQNDIVPPEKTTKGYQVVNLSLGGDVLIGKQKIGIALQAQNLFDTKYFNHTNYYRLINLPEAGRNIILNISIPFSAKMNNNQ